MITLYVLPGDELHVSSSPFCVKTAAYLKLSGIDHEIRIGDPREAPLGKLPYIRHEGGLLADSGRIERWCVETYGDRLDAQLDADQRATAHLLRRTVEEHLYWAMVYSRWIDPAGWEAFVPFLKTMLPAAVRPFLPAILRRGLRKSLHAQGLGRHGAEEVYRRGCEDLEAVARLVASTEGPFLFGQEPTSYDAMIYGFLNISATAPHDNPLTRTIRASPALMGLIEAVNERLKA